MSRPDPPSHVWLPLTESHDPAERLSHCMRALHRLVSDRLMGTLQSELQDEDVSFTQMTALYKVRAFAPISVSALAEQLGVSLPATSQLIQSLVQRGLMERRENPENRREKQLDLSDKGQQFLSLKESTMMGAYAEVFGEVDPQIIHQTVDALSALLQEAYRHRERRLQETL